MSTTINGSTSSSVWTHKLIVTEQSTSTTNNTSSVKVESFIGRGSSGSYMYGAKINDVISVTGCSDQTITYNNPNRVNISANEWLSIGSVVFTVPHNSDGSKTITVSSEFSNNISPSSGSASGSVTLSTIPRYFTSTPKLEVVSKTETSVTIKWTTSENASRSQYKINNGSWVDVETNINKKSGTMTINNLTPNTTYTIYGDFMRKDSGLWCQTKPSISVATYNYPYVSKVGSNPLTIGNSQTLTLYNPLSRNVTVKMYQNSTSGTQLYSASTNDTSLEFTPNANTLYSSIPNSQTGNCIYSVTYGNSTKTTGTNTYKVKGTEVPTFSNYTYKDSNTTVTNITGNDQIMVKGLSAVQVTILSTNKMVTKNSASAQNYNISMDKLSNNVNYSTSDIISNIGTINASGNIQLKVTAYDSRNLNTSVIKNVTVYDYSKPVINAEITRLNNFEAETTIEVNGTYSKLTINNIDKNTINRVQYRYRENDENAQWSSWTNFSTTVNNGEFECTDVVLSLDNTKSYEFQIQAIDSLQQTTVNSAIVDVGQAIFFISSNNKECQVNGTLKVNGTTVNDYITDSGWLTATLKSNFKNYNDDIANTPQYRKIGKTVEIWGVVTPTGTIPAENNTTIFTLPPEFRPDHKLAIICQGSNLYKWLMLIEINGNVKCSRYGISGDMQITSGTWLPFNATFFVN